MKRIIIGGLLIAGMLMAGCAATNSANSKKITKSTSARDLDGFSKKAIAAYNANPENTNKIVCTNEKPVGSSIPKRICHWESSIKDRQFQDQQVLREHINSAPPVSSK